MKRPVVAIIQARMEATRLPNKMMLWLHGHPVIEWVRRRVRKAQRLDRIVFALPATSQNDVLAGYLAAKGESVFRGDQHDVLSRFQGAAVEYEAGTVVRVCADNPFVAGSEIDRLVNFYSAGEFDYAYNHVPRQNKYPDGLGAEITSATVLEKLAGVAVRQEEREHIFNYIWSHPDDFRIGTIDPDDPVVAQPLLKLDLDTIEDYQWLLSLPVDVDMTARELVVTVLRHGGDRRGKGST